MRFKKVPKSLTVGLSSANLLLYQTRISLSRFLYFVGIQSVRILKRARRRCRRFFRPLAVFLRHWYEAVAAARIENLQRELHTVLAGILESGKRVSNAKSRGFFSALGEMFRGAGKGFRNHTNLVRLALNLILPVLSVVLLLFTVRYWTGLPFALSLENNGVKITTIENESVYEKATEMVNQRMVHDTSGNDSGIKFAPAFRLLSESGAGSSASFVCDKLIEQSNGIIEEASGLYVDGELLGVVQSGADLRYLLQNLLNAARGSNPSVTARFTQNVEIVNGLFPTTSLISTDAMEKTVTGTSRSGVTYLVRDGDTVTSIAKANHVTIAELNKINGNRLGDSIHSGDLIHLEVAVPKLSVELMREEKSNVPISYRTVTQNDDSKYTDYSQVIQEGKNGLEEKQERITTVNGVETSREAVSETVLTPSVDRVVVVGTKKRPQNQAGLASGNFMWPVPSLHVITTYFTWRWGQFHTGIDISGSSAYGKTIVAADGGVVTSAGWDGGGYGNRVVIDHGNGFSTLYGHASKVLVSPGQKVAKGQAIADVGSTGNSTGAHCHFEVIRNNEKVNPILYLH